MTLPSSTTSTAGSVTLDPTSPARVSTVRTSSTAAFSCLPPQRTIAYTEELSLCLCGPTATFRPLADLGHEGGLASLAPGTLATQPWICPVRWVFRLSDPGGRRCLRCRLPRLRGHVRWTRLPGGRPPPAPSAERLRRPGVGRLARAVAGHLRRALARRGAVGGARLRSGSGRRGVVPGGHRLGGFVLRRAVLVRLALPLPPSVLARLAVPLGLAFPGGRAIGPAPVTVPGVVHPVQEDQQAAAVATLARLGERFEQPGTDPLAGHLHQAERGHLGHLVLGPVPGQALQQPPQDQFPVAFQHHVDEVD